MFIVDKAGRLAYMGGIDDRPYADPASLKGAKNYVAAALADLKAGRPVAAGRSARPMAAACGTLRRRVAMGWSERVEDRRGLGPAGGGGGRRAGPADRRPVRRRA